MEAIKKAQQAAEKKKVDSKSETVKKTVELKKNKST